MFFFHRGTANPAVKPGLAAEFRLIVWLKSLVFRCFGYVTLSFVYDNDRNTNQCLHFPINRKRSTEYEQIVVTPSCPGVDLRSDQLNEENEDFSSRRRYHQTSVIQGHVDDVWYKHNTIRNNHFVSLLSLSLLSSSFCILIMLVKKTAVL